MEHQVDVLDCLAQVVLQRHGVLVEIEKDEAAVAVHARYIGQAVLAPLEGFRVGVRAGHAVEFPVLVVAPAVVEAGVGLGVALAFAGDGYLATLEGVHVRDVLRLATGAGAR